MINYIDEYGRYHVKEVTEINPLPTNNGYIYSFYAKIIGLPVELKGNVLRDLSSIDAIPLNRHPDLYPPKGIGVSHDEYVGAAGLDQIYAADIVEYGEKNHFQYCDIPGFNPTPFRKLIINDVLSAFEDLANEKENPRHAIIKYPILYPLAFWHRPEHQYFYYRCAGRSPGAFRSLYFVIASLFTILAKDQSPMFFFKTLKFKQLRPNLLEKALIKLYTRRVDYKQVCRDYFPAGHPILEKVLNVF